MQSWQTKRALCELVARNTPASGAAAAVFSLCVTNHTAHGAPLDGAELMGCAVLCCVSFTAILGHFRACDELRIGADKPLQGVTAAVHCSHLILGKKVQVRKPAPGASDAVPSRKRPTPVNLASAIKRGNSAISQRPFKDRVVHLLALKPYKKPELILRLQKDGLSQQDKDLLDNLLQQVCTLMEASPRVKGNVFSGGH